MATIVPPEAVEELTAAVERFVVGEEPGTERYERAMAEARHWTQGVLAVVNRSDEWKIVWLNPEGITS